MAKENSDTGTPGAEKKTRLAMLDELGGISNASANALDDLTESAKERAILAQREIDKESDLQDTDRAINVERVKQREKRKEDDKEAQREAKGVVLVDGRPQRRLAKPKVEPGVKYENYPIKTIDGVAVVFIGAVPFWNKECTWDEGYRENSEHFQDTDHPQYYNAVYCKIKYTDLQKLTWDAWVIRTDQEIQLYRIAQ